jgi:hypothetical protein
MYYCSFLVSHDKSGPVAMDRAVGDTSIQRNGECKRCDEREGESQGPNTFESQVQDRSQPGLKLTDPHMIIRYCWNLEEGGAHLEGERSLSCYH